MLRYEFLTCFFAKNLSAAQAIWSKWGIYNDVGEFRNSIWPALKKKKIFDFVLNPPPLKMLVSIKVPTLFF